MVWGATNEGKGKGERADALDGASIARAYMAKRCPAGGTSLALREMDGAGFCAL